MRETHRYLELEISRTLRYHTPFSCLSISVANVTSGKQLRGPTPSDLAAAFLEITRKLRNSLRNLDFIGSLGTLRDNHIFVIMTMTDMEGCQTVAMRLGEGIKEFPVEVEDIPISVAVIISAVTFNPEETPDLQSFIRKVKFHLQKEMKHAPEE
jgi:PleD family two-component response regulator